MQRYSFIFNYFLLMNYFSIHTLILLLFRTILCQFFMFFPGSRTEGAALQCFNTIKRIANMSNITRSLDIRLSLKIIKFDFLITKLNIMRRKIYRLMLTGLLIFGVSGFTYAQDLSNDLITKIENEIAQRFDISIKAGEKLDITGISENIDDTLKTGFIDNGFYFKTFEELMIGFNAGIKGLESQEMNVKTKKITVLSEKEALLTAHGSYSAKVVDGRLLTGKFAWTFVYSKMNGNWKVIHTHMSNPK